MNGYNPYDIYGQQVSPLAGLRAAYATELNDPTTLQQLYSLTQREVGGQGPAAQQAFMESVFNRAAARGMSLRETIRDPNYFPSQSLKPASLGQEQFGRYGSVLGNVLQGSNISNYATGNASGSVGFAGGPQTFAAGGERFGIEGPDRSFISNLPGYTGTPAYLTRPTSVLGQVQGMAAAQRPMTAPVFAQGMANQYGAPPAGAQMSSWQNYQTALTTPTTGERVGQGLGILGQALGQMGGQQQQQQALNQGTQAAMGLLNRPAAQIPQVDPLQLRQMLEMYFG